jgi:hypothetical protein
VGVHPRATRRYEVLERLRANRDRWIETPELSSGGVGGSEGTRRLRELRGMGYVIEARANPDPRKTAWQYRLTFEPTDVVIESGWTCVRCGRPPVTDPEPMLGGYGRGRCSDPICRGTVFR